MKWGTGFSKAEEGEVAVREALDLAIDISGEPALTFMFYAGGYSPENLFKGYRNRMGDSPLVGATVPGLIIGNKVKEEGVSVLTVGGSPLNVATALVENISSESFAQGKKAGQLLKKSGIKEGTVFVFPDGFAANISELLRGIYDEMGAGFSYAGGGAGENLTFYKTYQFTEKGYSSSSVALALWEDTDFQIAAAHGWEPTGEPMMVTRSEGKVVHELDGLPAFKRYSERLGGIDRHQFSYYGMLYPLGIPARGEEFLIRDPLAVKENDSIELVSEIPENTVTMIMEGELSRLLNAVEQISRRLSEDVRPEVTLVFDCVSRSMLMEEGFAEELSIIHRYLGDKAPLFGILTFGEVFGSTESPLFHNKSLVLASR